MKFRNLSGRQDRKKPAQSAEQIEQVTICDFNRGRPFVRLLRATQATDASNCEEGRRDSTEYTPTHSENCKVVRQQSHGGSYGQNHARDAKGLPKVIDSPLHVGSGVRRIRRSVQRLIELFQPKASAFRPSHGQDSVEKVNAHA